MRIHQTKTLTKIGHDMQVFISYWLIAAVVLIVTALTACAKAEPDKSQTITEYIKPTVSVSNSAPVLLSKKTEKLTSKRHFITDQRTCWDFPECIEYNRVRYGRH